MEFIPAIETVESKYEGYVSEACFYRVQVIRDCPDWDRCMVLDYDHLALCDLAPLFDLDLGDSLIAARLQGKGIDMAYAMKNWLGRPLPEGWEHVATHPYFLMGIMLNLKAMRGAGTWETLLEAQAAFGADEQLALTAASEGRILGYEKKWNLFPGMDWTKEEKRAPDGLIHWYGWPKPWHKHGDAWRKDLWESERSSWEHLRMGLWDKPVSIELDSADASEARALAVRGWKVLRVDSEDLLEPNENQVRLEDEFPDVSSVTRSEAEEFVDQADWVRLGAFVPIDRHFSSKGRLPQYLGIKGPRQREELVALKEAGYDRAVWIRTHEWPKGGPLPRVMEMQPFSPDRALLAQEELILELGDSPDLTALSSSGESVVESRRGKAGKAAIWIDAVGESAEALGGFLRSARALLLPEYELHFYVCSDWGIKAQTDVTHLAVPHSEEKEHKRSHCEGLRKFLDHEHELSNLDRIYHFSARTRLNRVLEQEIAAESLGLVHFGHRKDTPERFPYERNEQSAAYLSESEGRHYFTSSFFGGDAHVMLDRLKRMESAYQADQTKGLLAIWGLESYLNHDLAHHPPQTTLDADFAMPGEWREKKGESALICV